MLYKKGSSEIVRSEDSQLLEHALLVPPQVQLLEAVWKR